MKLINFPTETYTTLQGEEIHFRTLIEADTIELVNFYNALSTETRYLRFQYYTENLPAEKIYFYADKFCHVEENKGFAIVATIYKNHYEQIVGATRFMKELSDDVWAEFAIVLRDDFQRKGLGQKILTLLFEEAKSRNIEFLQGYLLPSNKGIIRLLQKIAPQSQFSHHDGGMEVLVNL
jgi:acetyltransferase